MNEKSRFALFFDNRGFFPAALQAEARAELLDRHIQPLKEALQSYQGFDVAVPQGDKVSC